MRVWGGIMCLKVGEDQHKNNGRGEKINTSENQHSQPNETATLKIYS